MERSESRTDSKISSDLQHSDASTEIKPYYRVHPGGSVGNSTDRTVEAALSRADALLQDDRRSCTEPMLSLVVPTYNAESWVSTLLETLIALQAEKEILVVDDASTDATLSRVRGFRENHSEIALLQHDIHRGHNATVRTGLAASFGKVVVVLDGITEIKTRDVVMLVKPILAGCCDVVYGSHHILSSPEQETHTPCMRLISRILTGILNASTGQHLSYTRSPLKAYCRTALDAISSSTSRRGTDIEMIFRLSEAGRRIYEMPLDSGVDEQASGRLFRHQVVTAMELLRNALRF